MFRFTIRDVLWLTALVAMGAGWGIDHQRQTIALRESRLREAIAELKAEFRAGSDLTIVRTGEFRPYTLQAVVLRINAKTYELSVGSDDGATVGTRFTLSRPGTELGELVVVARAIEC